MCLQNQHPSGGVDSAKNQAFPNGEMQVFLGIDRLTGVIDWVQESSGELDGTLNQILGFTDAIMCEGLRSHSQSISFYQNLILASKGL